ncbi:MAG: hypothetical protein WDW38_009722 [Sanguina aurantia]
MVWDSIYYVDIARYGWKFEHYYAFFPLLPAIMGLSPSHLLPVVAIGLSVAASVMSAVLLYWLTLKVLGSERHAATASLVYILGPASLFHSVAYTESLFTALTLAGLGMLYCRHSLVGAAVCFHLACWTRSNGIVNAGYLMHYALSRPIASYVRTRQGEAALRASRAAEVTAQAGDLAWAVAVSTLAVSPFWAFQAAGHDVFCNARDSIISFMDSGDSHSAMAAAGWAGSDPVHSSSSSSMDGRSPWCGSVLGMYGSVQDRYWGVGLGRYYTMQQIPNFLLAAPALALSVAGVVCYFLACKSHMLSGGFTALTGAKAVPTERLRKVKAVQENSATSGIFTDGVAVHIYPWAFQTAVALLVMHVQVATRFLSCCPPLHWFTSHLLLTRKLGSKTTTSEQLFGQRLPMILWFYCACYTLVGSTLFSNFYPWT